MFGGLNPFAHIDSMMNDFMMDPFAPMQSTSRSNRPTNQIALRNNEIFDPFAHHRNMMMVSPFERHNQLMTQMGNPFSLMNQMMSNMNSMFRNFDNMPQTITNDPNSQVYSSSTVMSISNSGDGKPKIYQESKQVKQGPGGVKETREMVRDSSKGLEKVAIGHHIGDRAHIIERQKVKDGQIEEIVNLENLEDSEVNQFNEEFENKIASSFRNQQHHHGNHHRLHNLGHINQPFAIEDGHRYKEHHKERKSKSKSKH